MKSHTTTEQFTCKRWPIIFKSELSLKLHNYSYDGLKPFKCEECGNGYGPRHASQWHMKTHTRLKELQNSCRCFLSS